MDQTALPMRDYGSFLPGDGVGGAGVHWNGKTWRFWESDFQIRSHLTRRYGAAKLNGLQLQDWGVSWAEIEPSFDTFEYLCGISGKAGNIKGALQPGGNPFESPRAREYPNPPLKTGYPPMLFDKVARELGYHPFPQPTANLSRPYVNPLGIAMGECTYCGFCERFGCANYSKASAQTTIAFLWLPVCRCGLRAGGSMHAWGIGQSCNCTLHQICRRAQQHAGDLAQHPPPHATSQGQ